ncbi:methylmalonyl-CoA mutase [Nocardioides sp. IC4_145]|uniref:methylmalonyl-CoA mutase family protein n=1 Tax=Nocardioides sp. IC4_145 TaxID=2714037 RepID=UPI00140AE84F|nr:methylmalonyl-CoA mutase family protein [Nocardioides sp. IC4_145]NHC23314.1 methylmalonyl-CoA mutase [Nocardioides sp. IC4_145]
MTQPQGAVEGGLDEPTELEPEQGTLDLAGEGDRWTVQDWEQAAAAVLRKSRRLKDDDPDDAVWTKLTRTTLDGIEVTPLGTPALLEGLSTTGRPTRVGPWDVRAHLGATGVPAKQANEEALVDLDGGVASLWVTADAETDLPALLEGVLLDLAPVVLDAPTAPVAVAEAFLAHLGSTTPADGTNLGVDGRASDEDLVAVARLALDRGVLGVVVDATVAHDLGASDAQELGYSMWVAARVLRVLTEAGFGLDEAVGLVEFRYAATDEQFPTIAKLRAARRLWARVLELSEAAPAEQRQHVVTSRPMMSKYDPYVNMLRTTVASFAAGVGGADAVTVLPFDSPLGRPDAFGRRIARNTSHLLVDEAHVAKVADPAGGAYAVEKLTDDLAVAGWDVLGRLDAGPESAQSLDDAIAETVARREREVATRKRPITGLTEFPNLAEQLPERAPDAAADAVRRYGAAFEELRDAPAARPVFLATMGTVAAHTARATFATNLLAAGGIAVEVAGPTGGVDDVVAAYTAGGASPVVCLAGSDAAYDEWADQLVPALREAGARHVIVAGKPRDGVDDSCAMGVDALAFLTRTREQLQ